jgi:hypothetical protein
VIDTAQRQKLEGLREEFETERRLAAVQKFIDTQPGWTVRETANGYVARYETPDGSVRFSHGRNAATLRDEINFHARADERRLAKLAARKKKREFTTTETTETEESQQ